MANVAPVANGIRMSSHTEEGVLYHGSMPCCPMPSSPSSGEMQETEGQQRWDIRVVERKRLHDMLRANAKYHCAVILPRVRMCAHYNITPMIRHKMNRLSFSTRRHRCLPGVPIVVWSLECPRQLELRSE